ncbi:MAG: single-stranded-DNA-specific exonuclease RecJ [Bacteroidota bacterium]|nr:single-stranded-DNA-specific exonuclease RecJ [Candidatus Kapabacteria bacterium]MCX7936600.1 single-stranded-DNA-specific exonuclease RecJ [Chlorobiota bacterium]MDW8074793.1 single-stranded-DNA-specific exonuclease RecJ [Bacteroidota bacterium]MDW8271432.1 single-stranded-DNA-specific exonuclease RecJ [Bacteroidota bacterium]
MREITLSSYRWVLRVQPDESIVSTLSSQLAIPRPIARVLASRGMQTPTEAQQYFTPRLDDLHDPFLLPDMERAVERIEQAIAAKETIWVHGDYDVDGTASTAMLVEFLRSIGGKVCYYIPERLTEGYGISRQSIHAAITAGARVLITVDCGITSVEMIEYARAQGLDVIVCDHHEPAEVLPPAYAILDPLVPDCPYPFKHLAACGVTFKLIQALCIRRNIEEVAFDYLDYVAVASAADIVPLIGENRILVAHGLRKLNTNPRPGFRGLIDCTGGEYGSITTSSIVYGIAPRINAAGRLGDARRAVEMMMQSDPILAFRIAQSLDHDNRKRRTLDEITYEQARKQAEEVLATQSRRSLVLHSSSWHPGVIGIVASRLVEKFHLPTILLTSGDDGIAKGSARSIRDFDIHAALRRCEPILLEYGGHKHAAGLALRLENIPLLRDMFDSIAQESISDAMLVPELTIDAPLELPELTPSVLEVLPRFAPYGFNNTKPLFIADNVRLVGGIRQMGRNQVRFRTLQSNFVIDAVATFSADKTAILQRSASFAMIFSIEEETKGIPLLRVRDVRPSDSNASQAQSDWN